MPENLLDQIIRQKLVEFQVPFQEQHWSTFVRDFLAPEPSHSLEDSFFQKAFSTLSIPASSGDWDLFEQLLPAETPVIQLTDADIIAAPSELISADESTDSFPDDVFREKLLLEELPFHEGDWELMANQLDGNLFDQAIRSRLHSYSLSVGTGDWHDLSSQIDAPMYASFKEHLGAMEVSYSHSDWRIFSRQWLGHHPWYTEWRNIASVAAVLLLLVSTVAPAFFTADNRTPLASTAETQPTDFRSNEVESVASQSVPQINQAPTTPFTTTEPYELPYIAVGSVTGAVREVYPTLPTQQETDLIGEISIPFESGVDKQQTRIQKITPRRASWNEIGLPTKAPYWTNWFTPKTHLHSLSIGTYASFGKTRAELSSAYGTPGFVAGLRAELGLTADVSLITGLQYERRGFSHRFYSYTPNQQSIENIIDADMQMAEIPLLIRYYVPTAPKVRMYGQAGIITMVSLKEEYQLYQNTGAIAPLSGPEGRNLRLADPTGGQQRSLETYTGNLYGGIGISVQATERIFLEAEPYLLLSLQKTKGSGALGVEKRMYHGGVGFSVSYRLK